MAEPARKYDPEFNPHERPKLKVIHGGGKGDGTPSGNLREAEEADSFKYTGRGAKLHSIEGEGQGGGASSRDAGLKVVEDDDDSDGKSGKWYARHKKKIIGGGIGGGIVGLTMFGFSFLHGPLQFIHISQLLQQFHLFSNDEAIANRGTRLIRYMRNPNDKAGRRLTVLQNAIATRYETKLKASGIEFEYNRAGYLDKVKIDPDAFDSGGKSPEEIQKQLKSEFDIDADINGNAVDIDRTQFESMFSTRKFSKFRNKFMAKTFPGRIASSMLGRPLKAKAGITLHPIKKLDRKVDEKLSDVWEKIKKKRDDTLSNGQTDDKPDYVGDGDEDKDGNKTPNADDDAAAGGAKNPDTLEDIKSDFKKSGFAALGAVGIASALCAIKGVIEAIDSTAHPNLILPLMRLGGEFMALGSQAQAGHDIDLDSLGYYANKLYDESKESNERTWSNARSIQGELGQELTGPDMPANLQPPDEQNKVLEIINSIPGVGIGCKIVENTAFQWAVTAAEFATGAGKIASTVLGEVAGAFFFPKLLDFVIETFGKKLVNLESLTGSDLGNAFNYGTRLFANEQAVTLGGRKLTPEETAELDEVRDAEISRIAKEQGFVYRTFSLSNPRSLMSFAYRQAPVSYSGMVSSVFKTPSSLFSSAFSNLPFVRKVHAQEEYEYSFSKYGFSLEELDNPTVANPIENMNSMSDEQIQNLYDKYKDCFGISMSPAPEFKITTGQSMDYRKLPDQCFDDRNNEDYLRFRFFVMDSYVAESMACYESIDDSACANLGVESSSSEAMGTNDGGIVGDIGENSDSVPCAAGTSDLGVVETKYTGDLKKSAGPLVIRLCRLSGIGGEGNDASGNETPGGATVNSRVSGAWQALGEKAKAEGIQLNSSSSFRLADSCGGTGDGGLCAKPGQSLHQTGTAIDFLATGGGGKMGGSASGSKTSCSGRARAPGDPGWVWLEKNAESFGFKQYSYEPWHWDPAPMANRCGTGQ